MSKSYLCLRYILCISQNVGCNSGESILEVLLTTIGSVRSAASIGCVKARPYLDAFFLGGPAFNIPATIDRFFAKFSEITALFGLPKIKINNDIRLIGTYVVDLELGFCQLLQWPRWFLTGSKMLVPFSNFDFS